MAAGIAETLVNNFLTTVGDYSIYASLAIGDPGGSGSGSASSVTTREGVTWGSASGGSIVATGLPSWTDWQGTSPETETYLAFWSASTGGTFGCSMQLSPSVTMNTGDTLSVTALSISIPYAT